MQGAIADTKTREGVYKRLRVNGLNVLDSTRGIHVKQAVCCEQHKTVFEAIPANLSRNANPLGLCLPCTKQGVKNNGVLGTFGQTNTGGGRTYSIFDFPKTLTKEVNQIFEDRKYAKHYVVQLNKETRSITFRCPRYKGDFEVKSTWLRTPAAKLTCPCAKDGKYRDESARVVVHNGVKYVKCSVHGKQEGTPGSNRCVACAKTVDEQRAARKRIAKLTSRRQLVERARGYGLKIQDNLVGVCREHKVVIDVLTVKGGAATLVCTTCLDKKLEYLLPKALVEARHKVYVTPTPRGYKVQMSLGKSCARYVKLLFPSHPVNGPEPTVLYIDESKPKTFYSGQDLAQKQRKVMFATLSERLRGTSPNIELLHCGLRFGDDVTVKHLSCDNVWITKLGKRPIGCPKCGRISAKTLTNELRRTNNTARLEASGKWIVEGYGKSTDNGTLVPKARCVSCGVVTTGCSLTRDYRCRNCEPLASHASEAELDWIATVERVIGRKLESAASGKQRTFVIEGKRRHPDGYDAQSNTVFEFLGDYWHGADDDEKRRKTLRRLAAIAGSHNVVYAWERDVNAGRLVSGRLTLPGHSPIV